MERENLGREQGDTLEQALTTLYRQETPIGFDSAWRAAVRREETIYMKTSKAKRIWKVALPTCAALVLVVGTLATGGLNIGSQSTGRMKSAESNEMSMNRSVMLYDAEAPVAEDSAAFSFGAVPQSEPVREAASQDKKIVRTAGVTLATTAFDRDEDALRKKTADAGGYVESLNQYKDGKDLRRLTLTLRIPSVGLDTFLAGLEDVGRVIGKNESAVDMTVQYADTALRLETQRSKMTRLQELLLKAEAVSDLLEIETEIANTQYEIDSYETFLRGIDRQVEFSSITVTLMEESPAESAAAEGVALGTRMGNALRASLKGIGQFMQNMAVFLAIAAPVIGLLAAVGVGAWTVIRILRRSGRKNDV